MEEIITKETSNSISTIDQSLEYPNYSNESCRKVQSDIISIVMFQPYVKTRKIKLNQNYPISVLNRFYPPNSSYVFNGQILDIHKKFRDYEIKNDMAIIIITSNIENSIPNFTDKCLKLTIDENFQNNVKTNLNKGYNNEMSRIKDLKAMKFEMKRKSFLINKFNSIQQFEAKKKSQLQLICKNVETHFKINYSELQEPSSEPLPIAW